ncbi:SUN domain-containing protein 1-like [Neodiprion fabricii]|uniref:SUN domain-containing protein 1-like n=1 Tax=Neodiprion fabricii TaxID=2872261 RepID=UPI001ED9292F|nr:SUN domain-containing protein 1-like [Neodiprion fabricii]
MSLIKMKNQYKDLSNIALSSRKDQDLPDFASEAAGGAVLDTPDTESYHEPYHQQITFFGIPIWEAGYFTPRKVIQPWTQAGECWAFRGSSGKILLKLAHAAHIDKVTLEHIPVSASLTGSINSAPRDFSIHAIIEHTLQRLDSFTYDINGQPSQTFVLKDKKVKMYSIETILLEIQSNWGHPDFTCIYRFRVHGKIASHQKNDPGLEIGEEK